MQNKYQKIINILLISISYFLCIFVGLKLSIPGSAASPLWPAAGLGAFFITIFGFQAIIPMFISGVLADVQSGSSIPLSTAIIFTAMIEIYTFRFLYLYLKEKTQTWEQYSEVFSLIVAALFSTLLGALFGNLSLLHFNIIPTSLFKMSYIVWFIGDFLGIMFFFPLLQELRESKLLKQKIFSKISIISIFEILLHSLIGYYIFTNQDLTASIFIVFLFVFLSFYFHNYRMALLAAFTYYVVCLYSATFKHNNFFGNDISETVLSVQIFFCSLFISVIFFSSFALKKLIKTIIIILSAGWIISSIILSLYIDHEKSNYKNEFLKSITSTTSDLQDRILIYESLIKANAGILKSKPNTTRSEWKIYSEHLNLTSQYPGINGIGFVKKLESKNIQKFEKEEQNSPGYDFKVHPVPNTQLTPTGEVAIIKYIEPYENNRTALGLELTSEVKRKQAIWLSAELKTPTMTDQIILVQDKNKGPGFLYYYPVSSNDNSSIIGWTYAPFIADVFFKSVIPPAILKNYDFKVTYPGDNNEEQILRQFSSTENSGLSGITELKIANKVISIQWQESKSLFHPFRPSTALLILALQLFWLLITSLVSGFLFINSKVQTLADAYKNELEKNQLMLVQTSKMSALGEMASSIAHEINNPLSVINGRAEILEKIVNQEHIDKQKLIDSVGKIKVTVLRIKKIINGLRSFSRSADKDPFTQIALKGIVDSTLDLCQEKFKNKGVLLEVTPIPEDAMVFGNEIQLSQVFLNLLNNSFDAIQNSESPWVKIQFSESNSIYRLNFIDSGSGIPSELAEKIMEPFFTTKEVGKGTGLGLSISKGIMQEHHGNLILDRNNKNTCFIIEIPKAAAP